MRTVSGTLQTHLDGETTSLARLWSITRKDAVVLRFTDHDRDLVVGGNTYTSKIGFTASSVLAAVGSGVQGVTLELAAQDAGITYADLKAGLYEGAQCMLTVVNWQDLTQGQIFLFGGEAGEIIYTDPVYKVQIEVVGKLNAQHFVNVEAYSAHCRADLGDDRCKFDLTDHHPTITVTVVTNNGKFQTSGPITEDDYWNLGVVRWLTGANAGLAMEVRDSFALNFAFELVTPMPFDVQVGDTAEVWPGCDKQITTCKNRFDNVANFHAEPFSPEPYITEDPLPEDQPVTPPSSEFTDNDNEQDWEDLHPEYIY